MNHTEFRELDASALRKRYAVELHSEEGEIVSKGKVVLVKTFFGHDFLDTLIFGGVVTPMHHRRKGYVREIFSKAWEWGIEQGACISLLHPFSFSYYEKFGYGKVSDHRIVRCPIRLLDSVPRFCQLEKMKDTPEDWEDLFRVHNEFSRGKTLMMLHSDPYYFAGKEIWFYRQNGVVTGYLALTSSKRLEINHYEDGLLTVQHIAYTTPEALKALLGFIRMYEGELDDVEFANLSSCPEVEWYLHHGTHTRYRLLPDLMVRVLNTKALLEAASYPEEKGAFTLAVEDSLPTVAGCFAVEYEKGRCQVTPKAKGTAADLTVNAPSLARLLYGYDTLTEENVPYLDGVQAQGNCRDFFRAFGKKNVGMFEHF